MLLTALNVLTVLLAAVLTAYYIVKVRHIIVTLAEIRRLSADTKRLQAECEAAEARTRQLQAEQESIEALTRHIQGKNLVGESQVFLRMVWEHLHG